jgi:site-specific DNA recombinase
VHGRREYRMNPQTGLRGKAIMNPPSALKVKEVPHLRIIDHELWQAVKARQAATRRAQRAGIDKARRPKFLFSKLTKCGTCGGGFTTESRGELRCNNYRAAGDAVCTNSRVIKRTEVEQRVFAALQGWFLTKERLDEFTRIYVAETNRLRAEHQSKLADARRQLEAIDRRQMQILGYLNGGFGEVEAWKVEVRQNEMRRAELEAMIAAAASQPAPPALHPNMAGVFEQKIRALAAALEHEDLELRESARTTLRGFIDRIVIPPGDALLQVVGNLGEMLKAAGAAPEPAAVGNDGCGGGI